MFRLHYTLTLLLLATPGMLAAADDSTPFVQDVIRIESDRLVYQGKSVRIPVKRQGMIDVFGPPSREIYNPAGNVVIWDSLGISCFGCQARDEQPEELQYMTEEEKKNYKPVNYVGTIILYARKYNPYPEREKNYIHEPKLPFPGYILLQGVEINGTTSIESFMQQRKGEQTILLPDNSFSFFIRCKPEPHEITLHTIRDKYDEDYLSIYSVSIRNIAHFYRKVPCLEIFAPVQTPASQETPAPDQPAASVAPEPVGAAPESPGR